MKKVIAIGLAVLTSLCFSIAPLGNALSCSAAASEEEQAVLELTNGTAWNFGLGFSNGWDRRKPEMDMQLDETEKAALYYENLLLYDAEYRVVYGEYGMFLLRIGQKEASQKLWKDYKKKEKTELLEEGESRNLKLWEEINEKK